MNGTIKTFNAFLYQDKNLFIASCDDLGTVDQGATPSQAITNLQVTTRSYLQESILPNIAPSLIIRSEPLNLIVPPLPQVSSCRMLGALKRQGFRCTKHCVLLEKNTQFGNIICTVPLHYQLAAGTIWKLLQYSGITPQEFLNSL